MGGICSRYAKCLDMVSVFWHDVHMTTNHTFQANTMQLVDAMAMRAGAPVTHEVVTSVDGFGRTHWRVILSTGEQYWWMGDGNGFRRRIPLSDGTYLQLMSEIS